MLTKEETRTDHDHQNMPEFREPEAWHGHTPQKQVRICFAVTNPEAWDTGTEAVIRWRGKKFRIICEGKEAPLIQTTRGILVGE